MKRFCLAILACGALAGFQGCSGSSPRFTASDDPSALVGGSYSAFEEGVASYYADEFHGRKTSNGETFDMNKLTAAHRALPFNSVVKVTNLANGMSVIVRINDRGPFVEDRIIDLSLAGAKAIDMIGTGTASVTLEVLEFGPEAENRRK